MCAYFVLSVMSDGKRFPLRLRFIKGKGYIMTDSLTHHGITNGSELISINGKSLGEVVNSMLPGLQAQGGNLGWKYVILENDFQNYYHYIVEHADSFEIEYLDHNSKQKISTRIDGSSEEISKTHWRNWYPQRDGAPLKIKFAGNSDVAVITIKSLSKGRYKAYQQDFDKLLGQYFEEISRKAIKNLIIDVRGNEGGNNPELLYSYIARAGDKSINESKDPVKPARQAFQGNVVVLMNERSISAQETFVLLFKSNKRGLTIGRPTPGSFNGLCGGNKRKVMLPNCHFEIQIPLHASHWTYSETVSYHQGAGFPPDFEVNESIDDILTGKDPAMELALDKIKQGL
jgi:hypothetical protein